jgi:hypothetical protein
VLSAQVGVIGAGGVGIEIEPFRFLLSKFTIWRRGLNKNINLKRGNFYKENISDASVLYVYLVPQTLSRLIPKFKKELKKGTRIVSYKYEINLKLLKEDKKTTKTARQLLSDSSKEAARFTENDPGRVYFNAEIPMSGLWKGLIGLHEVKHAKLYRQGEYRDGDEMDHWTEEADVFSFEHRLMEILGGEAYRARMAEMVTSLAKANPGDNPPQLQLGNPSALDLDFLDEIFGPNQSDRERTIRASTVWIDLVLRVLDQKFPDDPLGEKAHFLRQIYSS